MEKVTGIGGFFFRAQDPRALAAWYHAHLGVDPVPTSYDAPARSRPPERRSSRPSRRTPATSAAPSSSG